MPGQRWGRPDTSPRLHDPFDAFYLPVRLSVWLILRGSALRMNQLPIRILAWKLGIGIHPPPLPGKRTNVASSTRAPCIPRCRGPDCGTYFATEVSRIEPVWRDITREARCAPRASDGERAKESVYGMVLLPCEYTSSPSLGFLSSGTAGLTGSRGAVSRWGRACRGTLCWYDSP